MGRHGLLVVKTVSIDPKFISDLQKHMRVQPKDDTPVSLLEWMDFLRDVKILAGRKKEK